MDGPAQGCGPQQMLHIVSLLKEVFIYNEMGFIQDI